TPPTPAAGGNYSPFSSRAHEGVGVLERPGRVQVVIDVEVLVRRHGVAHRNREADVGGGGEEDPKTGVEGAAVQHLDEDLRVVLAEEPEEAAVGDPDGRERDRLSVAGVPAALPGGEGDGDLEPLIARLVVDAEDGEARDAGAGGGGGAGLHAQRRRGGRREERRRGEEQGGGGEAEDERAGMSDHGVPPDGRSGAAWESGGSRREPCSASGRKPALGVHRNVRDGCQRKARAPKPRSVTPRSPRQGGPPSEGRH